MKYVFYIYFFIIPFFLFSQNQSSIDSVLNSSENIQQQKSFLLELLNDSNNGNIKKPEYAAKKLIEISRETSDFNSLAAGHKFLGKVYYKQSSHHLAINQHKEALTYHKKLNDSLNMGKDFGNMGASYIAIGEYGKAIHSFTKALKIFEKLPDCTRNKSKILQNIGVVYWKWERNDEAISFYKKALEDLQILNDSTGIAELYQNIGIAYIEKRNYAKALDYLNRSKNIFEKTNNLTSLAISFNNIGSIYEEPILLKLIAKKLII